MESVCDTGAVLFLSLSMLPCHALCVSFHPSSLPLSILYNKYSLNLSVYYFLVFLCHAQIKTIFIDVNGEGRGKLERSSDHHLSLHY